MELSQASNWHYDWRHELVEIMHASPNFEVVLVLKTKDAHCPASLIQHGKKNSSNEILSEETRSKSN